MLGKNKTSLKWLLYGAVSLLCLLLQSFLLQRITIWGVIPFLYPVMVAVVASLEGARDGTLYGLGLGLLCDLLLPSAIPCFYTLIFPIAGLLVSQISVFWHSSGIFCNLMASAGVFILTDLFHCLLLWDRSIWLPGLFLLLREFCVTAVLVVPVTLLFRTVYRRIHWDD